MHDHTHESTANDHTIANMVIITILAFCGLTTIFLLGIF